MLYSRVDVLHALKRGSLKIIPFDEKNLQPNNYVLHLDNEIALAKTGKVDPLTTKNFEQYYDKRVLKNREKLVLQPGAFALARTREKIALGKKIGAFVDGKTTLARLGLSVVNAMLIHTGHGVPVPRKVVLELHNSGPFEIVLTEGMPICSLIAFELKTESNVAYDSAGQYGLRQDKDSLFPLKEVFKY